MRTYIKYLLRFSAKIISKFIHPIIIKGIKVLINNITSEYIASKLKQHPNNLTISFPISYTGLKYISIGSNSVIGCRMRLDAFDDYLDEKFKPSIEIGNDVFINNDCHIGCINKIFIGNNVVIASKVFITDHFHGNVSSDDMQYGPRIRKLYSKGAVIIEDNVLIGEGVAIMPNVKIGKNCIIGANSVVTKSFSENSVIAGNPAILLKKLN